MGEWVVAELQEDVCTGHGKGGRCGRREEERTSPFSRTRTLSIGKSLIGVRPQKEAHVVHRKHDTWERGLAIDWLRPRVPQFQLNMYTVPFFRNKMVKTNTSWRWCTPSTNPRVLVCLSSLRASITCTQSYTAKYIVGSVKAVNPRVRHTVNNT